MFQESDSSKTPISELGEFGLIQHLLKNFKVSHSETLCGPGDDAAVLKFSKSTVISTDLFTEAIHFNLAYVPLQHLGYKSVVAAISDIVAMNAHPKQIMVSLGISSRFTVEVLDQIYEGIHKACSHYQLDVIGGDTTSSKAGLVISITAIGEASTDEIVYRSGVQENNLLVVTGDLGAAYMGLQILERENVTFQANPNHQPDLSPYQYAVGRQLKPEARVDILQIFKEKNIQPTAMIDISDGLASEIIHLSTSSNMGIELYEDKLPLDPEVMKIGEEFSINPTIAALNGGEDYELLFTVPISEKDKIESNPNFTIIGHSTESHAPANMILSGSKQVTPLVSQGWKT